MSQRTPLLFTCSGCSNAGLLADQVARELDRRGVAEMCCLAGVGAAKPLFLKKLVERDVWVIDGCPIECSLGVFAQVHEHVDVHLRLHEYGVRKNAPLLDERELHELIEKMLQDAARQMALVRDNPVKD